MTKRLYEYSELKDGTYGVFKDKYYSDSDTVFFIRLCEVSNEEQARSIVGELNRLAEENEQLKQFKEKVFVLLDEKIKHYEHKPFSAPVGQPMSVNFDADVDRLARLSELQDLEKELGE